MIALTIVLGVLVFALGGYATVLAEEVVRLRRELHEWEESVPF